VCHCLLDLNKCFSSWEMDGYVAWVAVLYWCVGVMTFVLVAGAAIDWSWINVLGFVTMDGGVSWVAVRQCHNLSSSF